MTRVQRRFVPGADRGMTTIARIRHKMETAGLTRNSALKAADLRKLARSAAPSIRSFRPVG